MKEEDKEFQRGLTDTLSSAITEVTGCKSKVQTVLHTEGKTEQKTGAGGSKSKSNLLSQFKEALMEFAERQFPLLRPHGATRGFTFFFALSLHELVTKIESETRGTRTHRSPNNNIIIRSKSSLEEKK